MTSIKRPAASPKPIDIQGQSPVEYPQTPATATEDELLSMIDAEPARAAEFSVERGTTGLISRAPLPPNLDTTGLDALKPGDASDDVKRLQNQLLALGVPGLKVSGTYDKETRAAVAQLQRAAGLTPDNGVMNEDTAARLDLGFRVGGPFSSARGHSLAGRPPAGSRQNGYPTYDQNKNPPVKLGNSQSATLQGEGCVVTSFAMAASKLTGQPVMPNEVNQHTAAFGKNNGVFHPGPAAAELGLKATSHDMHEPVATTTLKSAVDKGAVLLRVDHNDGGEGDHTVLITSRSGDTLYGIDPAGGWSVEMKIEADGNVRGAGWRHYEATGFTALEADPAKLAELKKAKAANAAEGAAAKDAAPKEAATPAKP